MVVGVLRALTDKEDEVRLAPVREETCIFLCWAHSRMLRGENICQCSSATGNTGSDCCPPH